MSMIYHLVNRVQSDVLSVLYFIPGAINCVTNAKVWIEVQVERARKTYKTIKETYESAKQKVASLSPKQKIAIVVLGALFMLLVLLDLRNEHGVCRRFLFPVLRFVFKIVSFILSVVLFLLFQVCSLLMLVLSAVVFLCSALPPLLKCLARLAAAVFEKLCEAVKIAFESLIRLGKAAWEWLSKAAESALKTLGATVAGGAALAGLGAMLAGLGAMLAASSLGLWPFLLLAGLLAAAAAAAVAAGFAKPESWKQIPIKFQPVIGSISDSIRGQQSNPMVSGGCFALICILLICVVCAGKVVKALLLGGLIVCVVALGNPALIKRLLEFMGPGLHRFTDFNGNEHRDQNIFVGLVILICMFTVLLVIF